MQALMYLKSDKKMYISLLILCEIFIIHWLESMTADHWRESCPQLPCLHKLAPVNGLDLFFAGLNFSEPFAHMRHSSKKEDCLELKSSLQVVGSSRSAVPMPVRRIRMNPRVFPGHSI